MTDRELPPGYVDPTPAQVADAEHQAAFAALRVWATAMFRAVGVDADVPLDDDVIASLGPALPTWLADGIARAQAGRDLAGILVEEG